MEEEETEDSIGEEPDRTLTAANADLSNWRDVPWAEQCAAGWYVGQVVNMASIQYRFSKRIGPQHPLRHSTCPKSGR